MNIKTVFFTCFIVSAKLSFSQTLPPYVSTAGLQGFWLFAGNNNDFSGNGYTGTANGASSINDRNNTPGAARAFNGAGNYILTNYPGIMGSGARAISFWTAVDTTQGQDMEAVGWGNNTAGNTGGRFSCSFNKISGYFNPSTSVSNCISGFIPPTPILHKKWHHYVYQFNGTVIGDVEIYEDAIRMTNPTVGQNTGLNTQVFTTSGNNVTFGRTWLTGTPSYFKGSMDDIGLWNRTLTQCEISDLYYADAAMGEMTFNPAGYSSPLVNLAQYSHTVTGTQFPVSIIAGTYSGTGVAVNNGVYSFNTSPLAPGSYTIAHTFTLQGGCVKTTTQSIKINGYVGMHSVSGKPEFNVEIHPNPAADQIYISGSGRNEAFTVKIFDTSGKNILSAKTSGTDNSFINTGTLCNGIYIAEIQNEDLYSTFKKLVISR